MNMKIKLFLGLLFMAASLHVMGQQPDAELLEHTTNIEVDENKLTKEVTLRLKINNRAGEEYTQISLPFSEMEKLKNISAHIEDASGNIIKKLRRNDITERSAISHISLYEDNYVKEFTLKHNVYPYILVFSFEQVQKEFFFIETWVPVLDASVPTNEATLSVTMPHDYQFAYSAEHVAEPKESRDEEGQTYCWQAHYSDLYETENMAPAAIQFLPHVIMVPKRFTFDIDGSLESWTAFGNWQSRLLEGQNRLPETEKQKIDKLIEGIVSDKEKVRVLYHYLQDETRYINVSIETGGLKPYPASYVAQNKYGDCKALTNYFKSVLAYVGVEALYTKVYAGTPIRYVDTDFPSQQSNHIILYIPLKNEDLWLDCTSDAAFGYLGTFTQNRKALVVDVDSSRFKHTPALKPEDVKEERNVFVAYSDPLAVIKYTNQYRGDSYESLLSLTKDYSTKEKTRIVRNHLIDDGEELHSFSIKQMHRDTAVLAFVYTVSSSNVYKQYGNDVLIHNLSFDLPVFEKPKDRKLPVQLDYPIFKEDNISYTIPDGYSMSDTVSYRLSGKYGRYEYEAFEKNGIISVKKYFLMHAGVHPIEEYKDFYKFYKKVVDYEHTPHLLLSN